MITISSLTAKRNKLVTDATAMVNNGSFKTAQGKPVYEGLLKEADDVADHLSMLEQIERAMPNLPNLAPPVAPVTAAPAIIRSESQHQQERRNRMNHAWRSLLYDKLDSRIPEHRDLLTTTGGGATVGTEFNDFSVVALKAYAPLMNYVRRRDSENGRGVHSGIVNDTGNGMSLVAEGTTVPEIDPGGITGSWINTDTLSAGLQKYSVQLAQDAAFDLTDFLIGLSAVRYGRGIERALTLGTDQTGTTLPNNPGLVNIASVGVTTSTLASNVTFLNLANLHKSLDTAYLPRAVWQMNAATRLSLITTQLDSTNRSLFLPSPTVDGVDMLLGCPVVVNSSLPNLGTANAVPVLFGDLYNGIEVVGSLPKIITLQERWADTFMRGIILRSYVGSAALASGAIMGLKLAAS